MKIDCSRRDDITIVTFRGEFDFGDVASAAETIGAYIEEGAVRLVFDLQGLRFISSGGLGYFIQTAKRVRVLGGDVVLARPPASFRWIVETLGIDRVLKIFPGDDEAVAYLRDAGRPETALEGPTQAQTS